MTKEQNQGVEAVTTLAGRYDSIKPMIVTYGRLYDISREVISAHMPVLYGARPKYLYQILLAVARLKQPSKAMVIHTLCADKGSALQAIDHLHSVGYLRSVDKPRLIKPFRKYKIDKGYELTDRGWQALCAIILGE